MTKNWPRFPASLALIILVLDQVSKIVVTSTMQLGQSIALMPAIYLTYVHNPGGAFSLLADSPAWVRQPLFFTVTVAAFWVGYSYWKSMPRPDRISETALGLVAGGALGNQIDRLRFGYVIDFAQVDLPTGAVIGWMGEWVPAWYTWPIFNVADSAVCIGISFLCWRMLKPLKTEENAPDPV